MSPITSNPTVQVGSKVPCTNISLKEKEVELRQYFSNKKGLFLGVYGAYEPLSTRFLVALAHALPALMDHVDLTCVISVNDPYVLKAWGRRLRLVDQITFISDVNAVLTNKLGLGGSLSHLGFGKGIRTKLFAMAIEEGAIITYLDVESPDPIVMIDNVVKHITQSALRKELKFNERIKISIPHSHPDWKTLDSDRRSKKDYLCYIPKEPIPPADDRFIPPLIDLSSFGAEKELTVSNCGRHIEIDGFSGSIEYAENLYCLEMIKYTTLEENKAHKNSKAEFQILFKAEQSETECQTVIFAFPLEEDGFDIVLSALSLPGCCSHPFPLPPNETACITIKDEEVIEHGVSHHFHSNLELIHYSSRHSAVFVNRAAHGISRKQIKTLQAMVSEAHYNTRPENVVMAVTQVGVDLIL